MRQALDVRLRVAVDVLHRLEELFAHALEGKQQVAVGDVRRERLLLLAEDLLQLLQALDEPNLAVLKKRSDQVDEQVVDALPGDKWEMLRLQA